MESETHLQLHKKCVMSELISDTTWNLLVASYLPGVGKSTLWQIASDPDFHKTSADNLGDIYPVLSEFGRKTAKLEAAMSRAKTQLDSAVAMGAVIIGYHDLHYPSAFRNAPNAPAIFWYRGNAEALTMPSAAVIGTRYPTDGGKISAQRIATALAEGGICVVSGLALGIDAIAHEACVAAASPTVAVLAGGLEKISPRTNAILAENIVLSGGGLLSEFAIGMPTLPANFVTRDATQAAMSALVVMIQSDTIGGSMHASRAAVKLKRKLVIAAPIQRDIQNNEPKIDGNLAFMKDKVRSDSKMGFPPDVMSYVQILNSRNEYPDLITEIKSSWEKSRRTSRL